MAKEVEAFIKLQIKGGAANPSPPVWPPLGAKGVKVLPVVISVFKDKSFEFIIKTPPAAVQILEAAKLKGGSPEPNRKKVGSITWEQARTIAEDKMADLNCFTVESAMRMIAGTARSMGVTMNGEFPGSN